MWWRQRADRLRPLPAQVREGLGLRRGERVLGHAEQIAGGWVVATTSTLSLVDPLDGPLPMPGTPALQRFWHEVAEARWDPQAHVVDVRWVDEPTSTSIQLGEQAGDVPQVVRERVMSTYVISERVPVAGRTGVTVAVRRHAVDGSLFTQVVPDRGVTTTGDHVADHVKVVTRDLAEQAGLR
ncbi:MAG: hypothetical protein ACRC35_05570 [Angustibacter sp.]